MRRCHKCNQFFRMSECTCPFCGQTACAKGRALKAALLGAAAAAATASASCGFAPRPLYGVVVFDAGTDGGK